MQNNITQNAHIYLTIAHGRLLPGFPIAGLDFAPVKAIVRATLLGHLRRTVRVAFKSLSYLIVFGVAGRECRGNIGSKNVRSD